MTEEFASKLITKARQADIGITTAESCTGGLIMGALTAISGSSAVIDSGFVTYSNQAKQDLLGVSPSTLDIYGAVSAETAFEMVTGAANAQLRPSAAISVTGIAGPSGGSAEKPVGLVYIGTKLPAQDALVKRYHFAGDRQSVREQTVLSALKQLLSQFD